MKPRICLSLAAAVLLASGASLSEASQLHRAGGLLYQDPHTVPGLTVIDKIPGAPRTFEGLPSEVDLSDEMPPVGDQRNQGSCVAWAFGYYDKSHTEWLEHDWDLTDTLHQVSPSFIYNQINGGYDGGAFMADAQKLICEQGTCMWNDMGYVSYAKWPSEEAFEHGIDYRGGNYYAVNVRTDAGIDRVKQLLADDTTCVLGINCYKNFFYIGDYGNVYTVHDKKNPNYGGHAVCIVGYDDDMETADGLGAFKLVNSWGTDWGDAGYWWMSYEAVKNTKLCQGYVYVINDRSGYHPTALARVHLTHPCRDYVGITFGIGPSSEPLWSHTFRQFRALEYSCYDRPFPDSNMVFDLSDGFDEHPDADQVYVQCIDKKRDKKTGTIDDLSATYYSKSGTSGDTPVEIPEYNKAVFAEITLSEEFGSQGEPTKGSLAASRAGLRNGAASFAFELAQAGAVRITVYDGVGRTLARSTANAQAGRNELTIKLPQSTGVYFYRLESGATSITNKITAVR